MNLQHKGQEGNYPSASFEPIWWIWKGLVRILLIKWVRAFLEMASLTMSSLSSHGSLVVYLPMEAWLSAGHCSIFHWHVVMMSDLWIKTPPFVFFQTLWLWGYKLTAFNQSRAWSNCLVFRVWLAWISKVSKHLEPASKVVLRPALGLSILGKTQFPEDRHWVGALHDSLAHRNPNSNCEGSPY